METPPPAPPRCRFRRAVRRRGRREDAVCGLIQHETGLRDPDDCRVGRDACDACCAERPASHAALNPVVASLIHNLCGAIAARGGAPGLPARRASVLRKRVEILLAKARVEPAENRPCDVVVPCADASVEAERAILSVLDQDRAIAIVHLVDDGGGAAPLVARFAGRWNVVVHRNPARKGPFATLHGLLPSLRSEFVALQDPATVSHRDRVAASVGRLVDEGADLVAAPMATPSGVVRPKAPGAGFRRVAPWPTLAFRRASLIDMGGIADRDAGLDAELLYRAHREGRRIALVAGPTVTAGAGWSPGPLGPAPRFEEREGMLRHHARGFPGQAVEADVVLPFHGHLDYVGEALATLLEQEGAEAIVHLVDDATPGGAEELLRDWGTHPRVRTYRNIQNIGQFHSFNNVAPYFETRLAAVQDADDLSRPDRLHTAGNLLRLADAEVFGGASRAFLKLKAGGRRRLGFCRSFPPYPGVGFFVENPTAMFRVSAFEALRGFGDYGALDRNTCGLDTEFYARAYYSGTRFAISRRVVVDYRVHPASAVRNRRTGWGSSARLWSESENNRRFYTFEQGPFDPRLFGALTVARGLTERLGDGR